MGVVLSPPRQPLVSSTMVPTLRTDFSPAHYTLIFSDEFDGPALDRTKWGTRMPPSGGESRFNTDWGAVADAETAGNINTLDRFSSNSEQQQYTDTDYDGVAMHQFATEGDATFIKLMATLGGRKLDGSTVVRTTSGDTVRFAAGCLRSRQLFKPTATKALYMTARMRLPNVKGTWPAFWLACASAIGTGQLWPPEIDILEAPLNWMTNAIGTSDDWRMHIGSIACSVKAQNYGGSGLGAKIRASMQNYGYDINEHFQRAFTLRNRWDNWALLWTDQWASIFFNDLLIARFPYRWEGNTVPDTRLRDATILFNTAVGGSWAGANGVDDAGFPCSTDIDYVRVYEYDRSPSEVASYNAGYAIY